MTDLPIGRRALNRALLARQCLLDRADLTAQQMIHHLVGMQAQAPTTPYIGLWSRLKRFEFEELAQLMRNREVARLVLMRSTIHLVTASDAHWLRLQLQPMLEQRFRSSTHAKQLEGLELGPVTDAGRVAVERQPRTFAELGALLAQEWPDRDPSALAQAVRTHVPLVQVPPRGIWGEGGAARHIAATTWLGPAIGEALSPERLVARYLGAFGPASIADFQIWSGLTHMGEIIQRMEPQLVTFRDDNDVRLFDLPDADRPDGDVPAPVRFLPEFDNMLLSHADRTRVISDTDRKILATANGIVPGAVLVDGFVRAVWKINRSRQEATMTVTPLHRLSKRDRSSVITEGRRLLDVAAATTAARTVVVGDDPSP